MAVALRGPSAADLTGHLKAGARLPATRDLAEQYGFARGTIVSAFEQLKAEGYAEGQAGSGTYVTRALPETLLQVGSLKSSERGNTSTPKRSLAQYGKNVNLFPSYESRPTRAFRPNLPALELFPMELWTKVTARVLRRAPTRASMGCESMGYLPLREIVAKYLSTSRGVQCCAAQIAIVSGTQETLDISARLLLEPGDIVCMEDPGYTGAAVVFAANRAKLRPIPVDDEGIVVRRLPRSHVRLVYVTPGHQFPLLDSSDVPVCADHGSGYIVLAVDALLVRLDHIVQVLDAPSTSNPMDRLALADLTPAANN